jgi:hypothetical protein
MPILDDKASAATKTGSAIKTAGDLGTSSTPLGGVLSQFGKIFEVIGLAQDAGSRADRRRERQNRREIIININGAIDPTSTALQIQRAIAKAERFGASTRLAGTP